MKNRVINGDFSGAAKDFSVSSADDYQQAFLCIGAAKANSDMGQIGALTPVFIENDTAQYYFEQTIDGHLLLFPVNFEKENGLWKVSEF